MFKSADLILVTKIDLIEHFDFSLERVKQDARALNPRVDIIEISSKNPNTIKQFAEYIEFKKKMR
jgi:hydrogenase nickel incorporation protein HypB